MCVCVGGRGKGGRSFADTFKGAELAFPTRPNISINLALCFSFNIIIISFISVPANAITKSPVSCKQLANGCTPKMSLLYAQENSTSMWGKKRT